MEGLLKCPHGLVTGCEERQGLKIYRHLQDGEACGLLNGLQLTPEEILLEMGQTFEQRQFHSFSTICAWW